MKKNNTMRVAAGLAVAALLSTCLVSGTFAKYTTSGTSSDSARVAKFGVTITGGGNAFSTTYNNNTIKSSNEDKVVAPGAEGSLSAATLTGTPEVKVAVSNEVTKLDLENWTVDGAFYCPLKVTVAATDGKDTVIDGTSYTDSDKFVTAIKNAVKAYTATYEANIDLSGSDTKVSPTIKWEWAFDTSADADKKDTKLGDAAAAGTSVPKIDLEVTTTVTQVNQ